MGAVAAVGLAQENGHGTRTSERNGLAVNVNAIIGHITGVCWETYESHKIGTLKFLTQMRYPTQTRMNQVGV